MNTDKACEVLSAKIAYDPCGDPGVAFTEACTFAISRMRELDSLEQRLRGIVAEFKEER